MSAALDSVSLGEAAVQEISVKWSGYCGNLLGAVAAADANDALADVTLVAGGRSFTAHRLVLSANSALFRALFQQAPSPARAHDAVVLLHEVEAECVRALLEFMYRGEVRVSERLLPRLLQAAEALRVCGLSAPSAEPETETTTESATPVAPVPLAPPSPSASSPPPPTLQQPPLAREESEVQSKRIKTLPKKRRKLETCFNSQSKKDSEENGLQSHHRNAGVVPKMEPAEVTVCESPPPPPPPPPPPTLCPTVDDVEKAVLRSDAAHATIPAITAPAGTQEDKGNSPLPSPSPYESPLFPCPFCPRVYNSWGFRRRHVKSRHHTDRLSCKWCVSVLKSTGAWYGHTTSAHGAPAAVARDSLVVLVEAHAVLTPHEPSPAALLQQLDSGQPFDCP